MFSELNKYKNNGHFFFEPGNKLALISKDVPDRPGVYYILRLAKGKIYLVYIGKSGTITQSGKFKDQLLKRRINNKQDGTKRQEFFDKKMIEESIEALDIYWFVTMDADNDDLPGYVEGLMIQRYYEQFKKLPPWNKDY